MIYEKEQKEIDFNKMKEDIANMGGLLYQYRPCRKDISTIYDIENIKNGVSYAQTPLNMNDPFDSMIGFSTDKIYDNLISMLLDSLNIQSDLKAMMFYLLKYKAFGKFGELIHLLQNIKIYNSDKQRSMHKMSMSKEMFIKQYKNQLYSKLSKKLKSQFDINSFLLFSILATQIEDITEKSINDFFGMDHDFLNALLTQIENLKNEIYFPKFKEILATLTISCFSASGWDNQLMWSHYANSYSGICVEYDFKKMEDYIGFVFPIEYKEERPLITLQDLGIGKINLEIENKVEYCENNIMKIFEYLLIKNKCWKYEEEWRVINVGESNTPKFIETPFVKSITLGLNMDSLTRFLIMDVCKERGIDCYQLVLSESEFTVNRELILNNDTNYDDIIQYILFLVNNFIISAKKLTDYCAESSAIMEQGYIDASAYKRIIIEVINGLTNVYYIKKSLNSLMDITTYNILDEETIVSMTEGISGIDFFVDESRKLTLELEKAFYEFKLKNLIIGKDYSELIKYLKDIYSIVDKIKKVEWNSLFCTKDIENKIQVIEECKNC